MRSPVANGQVINRATYDSSPIVQDSARVETPGHDYLGDDIDLDTLGLDDKATSELLGRGDTLGVFQLDGGAMRDLPRRMRPTGFEAKGRVNWRDDKMSIFGSRGDPAGHHGRADRRRRQYRQMGNHANSGGIMTMSSSARIHRSARSARLEKYLQYSIQVISIGFSLYVPSPC